VSAQTVGAGHPPISFALFRRPSVGWLQFLIILFWTISPAIRTSAIYIPDAANNPYWLPLTPYDFASGGPDTGDTDSNGMTDWHDSFQGAANNGTLTWWGGGSFLVNGTMQSYTGSYHSANVGDADGAGADERIARRDEADVEPAQRSGAGHRWRPRRSPARRQTAWHPAR
jgi:hypothetical protein